MGVAVAGPLELPVLPYQLPKVHLQHSVKHQQLVVEVGRLVSHPNSRMHNHNEVVDMQLDTLEELQKSHMPVPEVQAALMKQGAFRVEAQSSMKGFGMVGKMVGLNAIGPMALGQVDNSQVAVGAEGPCNAEGVVGN